MAAQRPVPERLATEAWAPVTKFIAPTLGPEVVLDEQLVARVASLIDGHRFTTIVAQGGSGKTTLAAAAAARLDRPVAWLRLAATDDDPVTFIELLALALERVRPGSCATLLSLVASGQTLAPHQLVGVIVNDLAGADPVTVVLDDLHELEGAQETVVALLDLVPEHVHVVATARELTGIPVARLRANGQLAEIGPAELAIDPAQAVEITARLGAELDDQRVGELVALANGWVTGLLLAARAAGDVRSPGAGEALVDYLAEEVLAREAADMQEFVSSIAILDELDPDRCATVSGRPEAARLLDDLRRRLGFLVLDHGGTLRLHDVFREHVLDELQRTMTADQRADLHRRAADGAEGPERVEHLIAAGEFSQAATTIGVLARRWRRDPAAERRLVGWIDRIPDAVRADHPWLDLTVAAAAASRLDADVAVPLLRSVIERSNDDDAFEPRCMAYRLLGLATHDFELFARLLELEADPRWSKLPATTRVEWLIGSSWPQLFQGRPDGSRDRVRAAIAVQREEPSLASAETLALNLGSPLAVWAGAVSELADYCRETLDRYGDESVVVKLGASLELRMLRVLAGDDPGIGDVSAAEREIVEYFPFWAFSDSMSALFPACAAGDHRAVDRIATAALGREGPAGQVAILLTPQLAASYRQRGRSDDLVELGRRLEAWRGGPPGLPAVMAARGIVAAELAWSAGDLDGAAEHLSAVAAEWSATFTAVQLDPECELALLRAEQGRRREALELLRRRLGSIAGELEAPARVALCGPALVPLLEELEGPEARAVLEILGKKSAPPAQAIPGSPEVLTAREVEVLELLATGASNADIADRLYVSVNTVKTHVQRVLTKLQATTRTEAVARARELRLI